MGTKSLGSFKLSVFRYRSTGILTPASSPEQRRSRRVKKSESSPETGSIPEHYMALEYATPHPVNFLPSPHEMLQSSPNNHYAVGGLPPNYAGLHDQMALHEYQHIML